MNILSDLYTALSTLDIPIETGVFKDNAPERYIVLVPMVESFDLHVDNAPGVDVQEVRLHYIPRATTSRIKMPL